MEKRIKLSILFIILFVILIIVAFIFSFQWTKEFHALVSDGGAVEFAKANDIVITETKDGIKDWEIYAATGEYDETKTTAILTDIVGNYYQDKKVVMSFVAPSGVYNAETKTITLNEAVKVVGKDNFVMTANKVYWVTTEDKIHATGDVVINKNNEVIAISDKAAATTNFDFFEIRNNCELRVYKGKEGIAHNETF